MKLAIVGGGWAGLSAAVTAADLGHTVTVLESAHTLGGRARRVSSRRLSKTIDNGQHILLGAYQQTLELMQRMHLDINTLFRRDLLTLRSLDGTYQLAASNVAAPLHLLVGLVRAKGLSVADKWELARAFSLLRLKKWQTPDGQTVLEWLTENSPSLQLRQLFWQPLCVAALNTPLDAACAQLFANVLRDSIGTHRHASDMLLARTDLSALWPDQVARLVPAHDAGSITVQTGHPVRKLALLPSASTPGIAIDGEYFDGAILACPPPSAHRLLGQLPLEHDEDKTAHGLLATLKDFDYIPIATLTLELAEPWRLPFPMLMLRENPQKDQYGQWLFNCADFMHAQDHQTVLQVVISDAQTLTQMQGQDVCDATVKQIQEQSRHLPPMPAVKGFDLIIEKRATFAARPGLQRPSVQTPWPGVWLAGDWTDTHYPAVLEGAVMSGKRAAQAAHIAGHAV